MKKFQEWLIDFVEIALPLAIAIVSGVISVLDLIGALDSVNWLSASIPSITLLVLSLLAGYVVFEYRRRLTSIQDSLSDANDESIERMHHIIRSLDGVEVNRFHDLKSCLRYVNKKLQEAQHQIDDLSWTPAIGKSDDLSEVVDENQRYHQISKKVANKLPYREVFIFNRPSRKENLLQRVSELATGYSCAYYESAHHAPLLQFMIIDQEEVIFLTGDYPYMAFRHPQLTKLFVQYYEDIWTNATPLKHGKKVYWENLSAVLNETEVRVLQDGAGSPPR